ncbi:hypothetical protein ABIC16_004119 [Sphingomonas sp. PvP055]
MRTGTHLTVIRLLAGSAIVMILPAAATAHQVGTPLVQEDVAQDIVVTSVGLCELVTNDRSREPLSRAPLAAVPPDGVALGQRVERT